MCSLLQERAAFVIGYAGDFLWCFSHTLGDAVLDLVPYYLLRRPYH